MTRTNSVVSTGTTDLLRFSRTYLERGRAKLVAVVALEMILSSITGVGLLMILPLLGLLGLGSGAGDNPIWQKINGVFERAGIELDLEAGLVLFVSIIALRAFLTWRKDTWQVEVEQEFQLSLRVGLYETLSRTSLHRLQQLKTSDFIQSTQTEIRRAQQAANVLFRLFSQLLNLGAYFVVAMILSFEMTLFAFLCGGIGALILVPLVRRTHSLSRQQIGVRNRMLNNLIEHIQGVRTARTLGLSARFVEDFRARCEQASDGNNQIGRLSARSNLVFDLIAVIILATFVYVGLTYFAVEPTLFVVLLIIFIRIFPSIGVFQNQVQQFASLIPSFRHYRDLLKELQRHEEVASQPEDGPQPVLRRVFELRDITFAYADPDRPVLRNATIQIEKGALTALGGHSGAGKSTLADIATGLLPPQNGGLYLDGQLLDARARLRWRAETSVVPQECFLFDDTVRGNLQCVKPNASEQELWDVLDAVNSRAFVASRDGKLDSAVGERGNQLSGGERQRISIARALLRNPQLLVLDEPTNNLDRDSEEALLDTLESLKTKTTLVVITHDERILARADRVYRLEDGVLTADERPRIAVSVGGR